MNAPDDRDLDRLLDDDGGKFGALYRRLPRVEPPRRLDRAVLGNAARAVRGQTLRRHRWVMAFGSAAGVVLAAGIAWHIGQDALQQQSQHEATRSGPVVVPVEPITSNRRHAEPRGDTGNQAPEPVADEAKSAVESALQIKQQRSAAEKPRQVHPKAEASPPEALPLPPPSAAKPFPALSSPTRSAPEAPPAAPKGRMETRDSPAAQATDALEEAAPSHMRGGGAPAPSSSMELRRDMQLAPDDWLAHIHQLLRQGRRQQATESLRLFHNAHPHTPLPRDLQALLE